MEEAKVWFLYGSRHVVAVGRSSAVVDGIVVQGGGPEVGMAMAGMSVVMQTGRPGQAEGGRPGTPAVDLAPIDPRPVGLGRGRAMGGVLSDKQIRERVLIRPFEENVKRPGKISYGVSSYGYDVRVGPHFKIFTPTPRSGQVTIVDPKRFTDDLMVEVDCEKLGLDHVIIPPNSFALCETVEYIEVPRDVLVICVGKSTYARCGLIVNVTPLEPEWRGKVTLEISNTTPLPAKVYANEGVAQFIFLVADEVCEKSYADKGGKYQDQGGLTLPKVD